MAKAIIILILTCCSQCSPLRASNWCESKCNIEKSIDFDKIRVSKSGLNLAPCLSNNGIGEICKSIINRGIMSEVNIFSKNEIFALNEFSGVFPELINNICSPHHQSHINSISLSRGESSRSGESRPLWVEAQIRSIFHNLLCGEISRFYSNSRADANKGVRIQFPFSGCRLLLASAEKYNKQNKQQLFHNQDFKWLNKNNAFNFLDNSKYSLIEYKGHNNLLTKTGLNELVIIF